VFKYDFKPNRPNVVARLTGHREGLTLLFDGHLDTVPAGKPELWDVDPFSATVRVGGRKVGGGPT